MYDSFVEEIERISDENFNNYLKLITEDIQKYEELFNKDFIYYCNELVFQLGYHYGCSDMSRMTVEKHNELKKIIEFYRDYYKELIRSYLLCDCELISISLGKKVGSL